MRSGGNRIFKPLVAPFQSLFPGNLEGGSGNHRSVFFELNPVELGEGDFDFYIQIVDGFRAQISAGVLQSGEKLPSVRELATELSINPNTIQRAYRQLEALGWIATVPGKGCFVSGLPEYALDEQRELLHAFDEAALALVQRGFTRRELADRLMKED